MYTIKQLTVTLLLLLDLLKTAISESPSKGMYRMGGAIIITSSFVSDVHRPWLLQHTTTIINRVQVLLLLVVTGESDN